MKIKLIHKDHSIQRFFSLFHIKSQCDQKHAGAESAPETETETENVQR